MSLLHTLDAVGLQKHSETLTPSQQGFYHLLIDWLKQPRKMVIIVAGGPGSGKTHTVTSCLNFCQLDQLRMALTARVAERIGGQTIHSAMRLNWREKSDLHQLEQKLQEETDLNACIKESRILLELFDHRPYPRLVVIDEIGMVSFWMTYWLIHYFFKRRAPVLFVLMGDTHQLRPVKSKHNIFSVVELLRESFEVSQMNLTESKRFSKSYLVHVRMLREFVDKNNPEGLFIYLKEYFPVVDHINSDILRECTRALAFKNESVDAYNHFYLNNLIKGPLIRMPRYVKEQLNDTICVTVKKGCPVFVTQNKCSKVNNGTMVVFDRYDEVTDFVECWYRSEKIIVTRNGQGDFPIAVAFAGTVHKFQGDTMDDTAVAINLNQSQDLNLVYTALSRVKDMSQIKAIEI